VTRVGRITNAGVRLLPPRVQRSYNLLKVRAGFGRSLHLVPETELQDHYRRALGLLIDRVGRDAIADYVEFGVYVGTSMICMYRALESAGLPRVRMVGFDSFEGLPDSARIEGAGRWQPGQFRSDLKLTTLNLRRNGLPMERVTLMPGWFEETATTARATEIGLHQISVAMIDCDLYSSAVTALAFCEPRFAPVSVVFFDEWSVGAPGDNGFDERRAFEEFLAGHPDFQAEEVGDLGRYKDVSRGFLLTRVESTAGAPR
jgi:O-methyltransferase